MDGWITHSQSPSPRASNAFRWQLACWLVGLSGEAGKQAGRQGSGWWLWPIDSYSWPYSRLWSVIIMQLNCVPFGWCVCHLNGICMGDTTHQIETVIWTTDTAQRPTVSNDVSSRGGNIAILCVPHMWIYGVPRSTRYDSMDGWIDMALCWAAAAAAPAHQWQNMNNIDKTIIRGWLVGWWP